MTRSDSIVGTVAMRPAGGSGARAKCAWTQSMGSAPTNGSAPVSIW